MTITEIERSVSPTLSPVYRPTESPSYFPSTSPTDLYHSFSLSKIVDDELTEEDLEELSDNIAQVIGLNSSDSKHFTFKWLQ